MDTETKFFQCNLSEVDPDKIISSGNYFSGSIYDTGDRCSWISFNLVNKEKMSYILKELSLKEGVKIEIFSYAKYPERIQ